MGVKRTQNESAHKVDSGEENSLAAPAGIRTRNLFITNPALLPTSYLGFPFGMNHAITPRRFQNLIQTHIVYDIHTDRFFAVFDCLYWARCHFHA